MISSYIGPQFCDSPLYFALLIQELLKARRIRIQRRPVLSKLLRALIDPSVAPVRALPRDERELFIAASNGHVLAFDNVSGLPCRTNPGIGDHQGSCETGASAAVTSRTASDPSHPLAAMAASLDPG
jgi:hypothetical protein